MSVIVPVYNKEDYLEEALNSALTQSLREIEVLVVDDGSHDTSLALANEFAARDPRVRVIAQANAGVAAARNNGLTRAQGTYVAFLDPDDWYPDENVLSDMVDAARRSDVRIAGGSAQKFVRGEHTQKYPKNESGYLFTTDEVILYADYQYDYGFWRFIYDREFLIQNGLLFPPYRRYQDPPFFIRAMSLAGSFAALQRSTYVYRVAEGTNWQAHRVVDVMRGMIDVLRIASEMGYHDLATRTIRRFNAAHIQTAYAEMLAAEPDVVLPLVETLSDLAQRSGSIWEGNAAVLPSVGAAPYSNTDVIDLSIIVPVYNSEPWLHECLLSVLGQSGVNIEVICVEDGSKDGSLRILRDYESLDHRIRVVQQPNGGLSVARNTGIAAARGRYLTFLDSDDYWRVDGAAELVHHADAEQLDLLQFDAVAFPDVGVSDESWKKYAGYYQRTHAQKQAVSGAELIASQLAAVDYKPSACLYIVRAAYLDGLGLRFVPGMMHEDNPFTFAALINSERVAHLPRDVYARRVRPSSIMTSSSQVASMRGYFISYVEMQRETIRRSLTPFESSQIGAHLFKIFHNVSTRYNQGGEGSAAALEDLVTSPDAQVAASMLERLRQHSATIARLKR